MAAFVLVDPEATTDRRKEEYSIVHFHYPDDSRIRKISTGHVYKQTLLSRFNFLKPYKIKTVEGNIFIENYEDVYLLSRDDIRSHRSKYKFLHFGLVQFSIENDSFFSYPDETLPVSVRLRDSKYPNHQDSILASFESDVRQGAIKFNWFPNISISLSDLANSNALVVTIDPPGSVSLSVRYRVCYKLMKTSLKPDYLFENPVLEVNTKKTNVVVTKSNNQS